MAPCAEESASDPVQFGSVTKTLIKPCSGFWVLFPDLSVVLQGAEQLAEAGASDASSEPSGPVRTQPESDSMVKTDSAEKLSKPTSGAQQRCVIS